MDLTGTFDKLLTCAKDVMSNLPDPRKPSNATDYTMQNIGIGGLSVFMMQNPSFLHHQKRLDNSTGKNNYTTKLVEFIGARERYP